MAPLGASSSCVLEKHPIGFAKLKPRFFSWKEDKEKLNCSMWLGQRLLS